MAGLGAGDPRRHDLAVLLDEVLQDVDILVIDLLDALGGKAAELLALEQVVPALALFAILAFTFAFGVSSHGTGHCLFPLVFARLSRSWSSSGQFEFVDVQRDGDAGAVAAREKAVAAKLGTRGY